MEDPLSARRAPSPAVPSSPRDGGQRESSPLLDSTALMPEKVDDITDAVQQVEKLSIASDSHSAAASASPPAHPLPPGASPIDPLSIRATPTSPPPFTSSSSPSPTAASSIPPPLPPDASFSSRLLHFHHCMNMERIPRKVIYSFVFEYGSPDQKGMRSLLWKLLLNYLPWQHADWEDSLKRNRAVYAKFVDELSTNPYKKMGGAAPASASSSSPAPTRVSVIDDPLAAQSPEWSEYYKDEAIRHEIDKDVKRTYSSFHFFQERVRPIVITLEEARRQAKQEAEQAASHSLFDNLPPPSSSLPVPPQADVTKAPPRKDDETHQDVIRRILFVYAKLNPGVRYVQGMNEILAPMYYVFAHDTHPLFQHHAEADAFFCFTAVMSDIRDRFIKSLDSSPTGVLAVVSLINSYLRQLDPELWAHLEAEKVDPRFYSFRWITLLLSQEFELPEVLRLWDSLFADQNRFEFLLYCCCSMLVCVRDRLLQGDFADALRMLQHYQDSNIPFLTILSTATRLKTDLEAQRRGEVPVNPVVKQSQHHLNAAAASNAAAAAAAAGAGTGAAASAAASGGAGGGAGMRSASPVSPTPSQQLNSVAEAASNTAGQFLKSVSSFFAKK